MGFSTKQWLILIVGIALVWILATKTAFGTS